MLEGLSLRAVEKLAEIIDVEPGMASLKAALAAYDRAETRRQARETGDRLGRLERAVEQLLEQRGLRSAA